MFSPGMWLLSFIFLSTPSIRLKFCNYTSSFVRLIMNRSPVAAPRPLRLVTAIEESGNTRKLIHMSPPPSANGSLLLSPEALEEFLSILRPARTPSLQRSGADPLGVPHRAWPTEGGDTEQPARSPESLNEDLINLTSGRASRWCAQALASPISRMHTRNPFPRYASQAALTTPVSPAVVPSSLPSPSPPGSTDA